MLAHKRAGTRSLAVNAQLRLMLTKRHPQTPIHQLFSPFGEPQLLDDLKDHFVGFIACYALWVLLPVMRR
jgi:hypothetical protein